MHSLCRTILFILRRVAKFKNLNMATHKCISINSREFHSAATQLSLGIFLPFRLWTACCGQAVQLWEALCYGLWQAQDMTCRQQYENSLGLKLMGLRVGFLLGLFLVGFFCFGCGCGLVFFTPPPPPTPPPPSHFIGKIWYITPIWHNVVLSAGRCLYWDILQYIFFQNGFHTLAIKMLKC